jgi:hypothetical protein
VSRKDRKRFMNPLRMVFLLIIGWGSTVSAAAPEKWTVTVDSPIEESDVAASTGIYTDIFSDVCFKISHIAVRTKTSTPVSISMYGGLFDPVIYSTTVTTDAHPEFGRAYVPIKGTPADKFVHKIDSVSAFVEKKGPNSLHIRVTFEFDPSVQCDEMPPLWSK